MEDTTMKTILMPAMQAYVRIDNGGDNLTLVDNGQVALTLEYDYENNAYCAERCAPIEEHKSVLEWFLDEVCHYSLRQWGGSAVRGGWFRWEDIADWCDAALAR